MESPGEFLRRERELRGVTIETISSELKLSPKTIKAIEDNDVAELPHSTYVKGFIRSYCHWLGLDDNDAILRYESYLRERTEIESGKKKKESGKGADAREEVRPTAKTGLYMTVVFAIVGIVLIIGYVVIYGGSRPDMMTPDHGVVTERDEAQPLPVEGAEVLSEDGVAAPETSAPIVVLPEVSKPQVSAPKTPVNDKEEVLSTPEASSVTPAPVGEATDAKKDLSLEIRARELTWVEVSLDKDPPYDITLREGERVSLKAAKVFF